MLRRCVGDYVGVFDGRSRILRPKCWGVLGVGHVFQRRVFLLFYVPCGLMIYKAKF